MTTPEGKEVIMAGWRATGILDAVRMGVSQLPSLDPFIDIDPPMAAVDTSSAANLRAISDLSLEEKLFFRSGPEEEGEEEEDVEEDEEDVWEREDGKGGAVIIDDDEED